MSRILRCLVCLLLICCILVNLSPLRAQAVSATAVAISVALPVAVAAGMQALGVRQGSDSSVFNSVVSSCADALSAEWAVNGLTTMLALTSDGVLKTYAFRDFLQAILDFFYDSGILYLPEGLSDNAAGASFSVGGYTFSCSLPSVSFVSKIAGSSGYELYICVPGSSSPDITGSKSMGFYGTVSASGKSYGVNYCWVSSISGPYFEATSNNIGTTAQNCLNGVANLLNSSITTSEDLTLESVGHDIETDYETYVETGIVGIDFGVQFEDDPNTDRNEEDDHNQPAVPVKIPSTNTDEYTDQTQADAQTGETPQEVLDSLLQNSGSSGDSSGSGSDSGSGSGTGTDTFKPQEMSTFFLDLSNYFPFCIPFDLYDFLTCLNADPVAPVIDWELYLPGGSSIPIELDLSVFDPVAQILRRLQLLVFCIGLAAKTRDLIKG